MKQNYFTQNIGKISHLMHGTQFRVAVILFFSLLLANTQQAAAAIAQRGTATSASSTNGSITINRPAGVTNGDIMIVTLAQRATTGNLGDATGTGWLQIASRDLGINSRWGTVLYKIATGAEPASYTFALDAQNNGAVGSIVAFSGVNTATPFDVPSNTLQVQGTVTGVVAAAKTTVTANAAVLMLAICSGDNPTFNNNWTTTSPGGLIEIADFQNSSGRSSVGAAWAIKTLAGGTGNGTVTMNASERNAGILIILKPAAVTPTITSFSPTSACSGTTPLVTINGANYTSVTDVQYNGASVAYTVLSPTQITFTLPAGASTASVTVNTAAGTVSSSFTVNPSPVVAAISGANSVCVGSTTTFSGPTGGAWSTSAAGIANVNAGGVVSGVSNGSAIISYTVTSGGCTTVVQKPITVNALPALLGMAPVCVGNTLQLSPTTGTWASNDGSIASITAGGLITGLAPGSATFTFTDSATNCSNTTSAVSILAPPSISGHPNTQSVCSGSNVSFSVTATGGTGFTWYKGVTPLSNGGSISGATTNTLTITSVTLADADTYYCLVSGSCSPAATSNIAALTVTERVAITGQPAASQSLCTGAAVTFTVAASGAVLGYQWYYGATPLVDGGTISGATTNQLQITGLIAGDAGTYHCVALGTSPCGDVLSNNSTLIVNNAPGISAQPTAIQTVCAGGSVSFSITASGGSSIYQWYKGATLLSNSGNISGADSATLTINPTAPGDSASDYYCSVSNGCVTPAVSSNAALTVNEKPFISSYTAAICSGDPFNVNPANGVPTIATIVPAGTTYSWPAPIVTGGITGSSAQSNQPSISETLTNPTNTAQTATYTVTPVSGTTGACAGTPFTVKVTVNPRPELNNLSLTACSGQTITNAPADGGGNIVPAGTTYSWGIPVVTGGMTGGVAGSGISLSFTLDNPTNAMQTASYTVTATSGTCVGSTFNVGIKVNPRPTVAGSIATQTICSGTAISAITLSNPNGIAGTIDYSWARTNTASLTGIASNGTGSVISGNLTNTTNIPQTAVFTLTATSDEGCASGLAPVTVNVIVNPVPTVAALPVTQTICSGNNITTINITNPNNVSPTVNYSWSWTGPAGLSGIAASGNGSAITGSLTNSTNTALTATFTVTAEKAGCGTSISTITVIVNPRPDVSASPNATQTICGETPFSAISISNPNAIAGTTFSWIRSNTANVTGYANSGSGAAIAAGSLINNTNTNQTTTFTINAAAGTCATATPATVDIIVKPSPLTTISQVSQNVCNLTAITPINFGTSNSMNAFTSFSWSRDKTAELTGIAASGSGNITGTFTNTTTTTQTATFTIIATATNGCTHTSTATVTVYAPLAAPVIAADQTVCILSQPDVLTMSTPVSGGAPTYTYQWQSSTSGNPALPWTNLGGASTTATTYQPGFIGVGANNTYYRLVITNTCGSVTSNTILIQVVSSLGFTFDGVNDPATQCPGGSFSTNISSDHATNSSVRYSWTANPAYITPATGNNAGTTGPIQTFFFFIQYRESSANLPFTVQNNTNATITTQISILPSVYDYPGPPGGAFQCSITPQIVNVTIRPKPVAAATASSLTICNVTSAAIQVTGNITDANMAFSWTRNNTALVTGANSGTSGNIAPGGTFTINNTLTNTTAIAQDVIYTITPSSNGCPGTAITITIKVAPLITAGTVTASQTICSGDTPTAFSQTAAATAGTSLQWQSSTDGISYSDISGQTAATYAPGPLTVKTWFVRVASLTTNGVTCSATSTPIIITINTVNSGSIATSQTICSGSAPAALTSTAAGTAFGAMSYEWEMSTIDCSSGWSTILGATLATYAPGALTATTYYRRKTKSLSGAVTCSAYSNCVAITVNSVSGGIVGSDQTLCGNNPAAFTELTAATAAGTISYQWQSNTTGCGGAWAPISGATAATYDAPAGVTITTYYRRITSSLLNSMTCTAASNCITVTPNPVTGGSISGNRTVCSGGDPAAFSQTPGTGTGLTYQWQMSTVSGTGPWTDILGAVSAVYDEPGPVTQTTYYQRIAIGTVNSSSCSAVSSGFVTVFVNDVTASAINGSQAVCGSEDPVAFTVNTAAIGNGVLSYQWQSNTTGCGGAWANIIGATSSTYDPPVPTQTTYYHVVVSSTLNSVVCTATSNCLTVISNSSVWSGAVNTDWDNPGNWVANAVPTSSNCVVIPNVTNDPIILGSNYEAYAHNLTVLNGGYLTVNPANAIIVTDYVNVNAGGQFEIKNNANLVQINNVNNSGIVKMERITQPVYRFDYTYWGSPMTAASNFKLGGAGGLSPLTQPDKYYSWIPSVSNSFGAWAYETAATAMDPAKGYIVRAPQTYSDDPGIKVPYTANFIGTPNNGDILCPIMHGALGPGNNNDKYNLLGNPYPSAVDAEKFLSDPANVPVIDGTIYFWTHNSPPSTAYPDPFYGDFVINYTETDYASWNKLGGAGTTAAATTGGATPAGYIAAGQGFFTRSTGTAPSGNNVVFKNSMRDKGNNSQFFRNASATPNPIEKHRIWLNLTNNNGVFNQILVGYAEGATEGWDRDFDGMRISETGIILYSVIPEGNLAIQGRPLPFNVEDQVALGYKSSAQGTFSLRIDHVDGLFEAQNIYVEDKLLNTIHDIKQSPYVFTTGIGTFNDRFVLRYTNNLLGATNPDAAGFVALIDDGKLQIQSSQNIQRIYVYDIAGKFIRSYVPETQGKIFEDGFLFAEGIYMVKIKLQDGSVVTQKLINRK